MQHHRHCEQHTPASLPSRRFETLEFLVISLFALRLVKQLIQGLGPYPDREADMAWIAMFLAPYRSEHALARMSGARAEDYTATYPTVVENEDASTISHRLYAFETEPFNETTS
jgi:hypothetical protein